MKLFQRFCILLMVTLTLLFTMSACNLFNPVPCETCQNEKVIVCTGCDGTKTFTCPDCKGSAKLQCTACKGLGFKTCQTCNGAGGTYEYDLSSNKMSLKICPDCSNGRVACPTTVACKCGTGTINCKVCQGKGTLPCPDCQKK